MKTTLNTERNVLTVEREKHDPVFRHGGYAQAESTFLHHVKKALIEQGHDVIKKRMWKDGHMMDETQQYIRDRGGKFGIFNPQYALYDAGEHFNEHGEVELMVVNL